MAEVALFSVGINIAKELGRSYPDPTDPTMQSYPNRQIIDTRAIRLSPRPRKSPPDDRRTSS
jgi:hypothetical protein